jgi:NADH-quinone oxidoreductase subunit M
MSLYHVSVVHLMIVPLLGAALLLVLPLRRGAASTVALVSAGIVFGETIAMIRNFRIGGGFQFATNKAWLPDLGVRFHVAVDGLSLVLIAVTVLVSTCSLVYAIWEGRYRNRAYFALLLILQAALILVFCARDLIVFYIGFEAMLIPFYFLIGVYGGPDRRRATIKFIIYTFVGTLLMLIGMIALGLSHGTFDLDTIGTSNNRWIWLAFVIAFAIKSPVWPLHGWVPDAYRNAPPEVAAMLSGIASKAGAYGLMRLVLPIFPHPTADFRWCIAGFATFGLLYGSLVAFREPDSRGVIAYSSISQMGLVVLGIFLLNDRGETGAAFQMVNHAILSAALFFLAGWVAHETGAEPFRRLGGLARGRPVLATTVMIVGVAALAVPGSPLFASEFLILLGAFERVWWVGAIASLAIILAAMYMLRWISAILHDREGDAVGQQRPPDLTSGALVAILPLVAAVLALSFYPAAITKRAGPASANLARRAAAELPK